MTGRSLEGGVTHPHDASISQCFSGFPGICVQVFFLEM